MTEDSPEKSPPLAKVTCDLSGPRGPDGVLSIRVPEEWRQAGTGLLLRVPKKAVCAICEGGGCDVCGRSGAISLREGALLELTLPEAPLDARLELRIPWEGAPALDEVLPRGHLLLRISTGERPSPGLVRDGRREFLEQRRVDSTRLVWRSVLLVVLMCLLFLGMLRLSGWL